jgi:hypothetical protein
MLCFDLAERGLKPEFATVTSELECPQQKRVAVWIDDQAPARDIRSRLSDASLDLLGTVLEGFRWRRTTERLQRAEFLPPESPAQIIVAAPRVSTAAQAAASSSGAQPGEATMTEATLTAQLSHRAALSSNTLTSDAVLSDAVLGRELVSEVGASSVPTAGEVFSAVDQRLLELDAMAMALPTGGNKEPGVTLGVDTNVEPGEVAPRGENATSQPLSAQTTPPTNTNSDAVKQLSDAARARLARSADFHQLRQQRRPL